MDTETVELTHLYAGNLDIEDKAQIDIEVKETASQTKHGEIWSSKAKPRESWSSKADFLLTCIGYCVGLSNVWRFPYLCYQNGGGAFLIPYFLALLCCGLPIICLEFFMGQYCGMASLSAWNICPLFKGIGYAVVIVNLVITIYYIYLIALAIYFFTVSFTTELPWTYCDNAWNTVNCRDVNSLINASQTQLYNYSTSVSDNVTSGADGILQSSPSEEYFNHVLNISEGIEDIGGINWRMLLCFLVAWAIIAIINVKGIKSTGKVVYFTATFPYVMLTILVIRGCTLEGSSKGIYFYLYPQWEKLLESKVWYSAAVQVFFSVGPGQGFMTLASYNKFHNNCIRDALITGIINCATSFYAGFAVFSVLGYMAHQLNVPVSEVVSSGPGLAFVVYPQAIATMPFAPFWAVSFFFMIILVGIDSELVYFETVITCLKDEFPVLRKFKYGFLIDLTVIVIFFCCGLIFLTEAGFYVFVLVDWYGTAFTLFIIGLGECLAIVWFYGLKNITENYEVMFGHGPARYFTWCWSFISPVYATVVLILSIMHWDPVQFDGYQYPPIARAAGWMLVAVSLVPIPCLAVYRVLRTDGRTFREKLSNSCKPTSRFQNHVRERINQAEQLSTLCSDIDRQSMQLLK